MQTNFKNSLIKITKVNTLLEDVTEDVTIISTHTELTNHRGITETYNTLNKNTIGQI